MGSRLFLLKKETAATLPHQGEKLKKTI